MFTMNVCKHGVMPTLAMDDETIGNAQLVVSSIDLRGLGQAGLLVVLVSHLNK